MKKSPEIESKNLLRYTIGSENVQVGGFNRTQASYYQYNTDPGISVRSPMNRDIYEEFRPNERIPKGHTQQELRNIMILCRQAYESVGVIRSVVDMMSEFGADGIEIIHPDDGPNSFYQSWSKKVNLADRAERFLSWFYKAGNVVVRRKFASLNKQDLQKISLITDSGKVGTGSIPLEYLFYDPSTIELIGGSIGAISPLKIYALRVPLTFFDGIRNPRNELEKKVYDALPPEIQSAIQGKTSNGLYYMPIPNEKIHVAYYKKDDSDIWAKSFIYSILSDVFYNDKLKLAKTSALDSWYNAIRLWQLGDHKSSTPIKPSPDAGSKLLSILQENVGGGAADIIWDSALTLTEYYPPIDKLVNFTENINAILLGLGVPDNLVGGITQSGSSSSINYIGLKNLIKRLEAGRRALTTWLNEEIDIIQKSMGFRKRPIIRFSNNDLHDEQTWFQILLQLVDRNVISDDTILQRLNEFPEIENARIQKQEQMRKDGTLPEKASPFHKPDLQQQQDHEIDKIKLQNKIQQDKGSPDNSSNLQKQNNLRKSDNGRPPGSKDTVTRIRRPNKRIKASFDELLLVGSKVYDAVDQFIKLNALSIYNIENLRQLTAEQELELDKVRNLLLANVEPFTELDNDSLIKASKELTGPIEDFNIFYQESLNNIGAEQLNNQDKKLLKVNSYAKAWYNSFQECIE